MAKFNQFEIRPLGNSFELIKWNENNSFNNTCFTIAWIRWDEKSGDFDFESVGTRYLKHREEGLEKWILAWCEMKKIEFNYKEEEE